VNARIIKVFKPFTLSCATVVQLDCPSFKGQFVLKLYDRRFSTELRRDEKASPWNSEIESEYSEFVRDGHVSEFFDQCTSKFREYEYWADKEHVKWTRAQHEAYLQYACHRIYKTEKEAYKNLHDIQGKHIPRLHARPCLQLSDSGLPNKYLDCPGLLLDYIQGFPLTFLADEAPKEDWQYVCEDAIRVVNLIGDRGVCNRDVKTRSFIVSKYPSTGMLKVFMIDFGLCLFRSQAKSDREFNMWQAVEDEEGACGCVMEYNLKGGFIYRRSPRSERLCDEFLGEDSEDLL
jgi:hypothetical protein